MKNWVNIVKAACRAEMPHYEFLQTVASFLDMLCNDLKGDAVVKRLAKFFSFDPDALP